MLLTARIFSVSTSVIILSLSLACFLPPIHIDQVLFLLFPLLVWKFHILVSLNYLALKIIINTLD